MIIIYTDKPMISRRIARFVSKKYQNELIVYIHSMYFMNVYFNYTNNLKWKDFPLLSEPQFKISPIEKWRPSILDKGNLIPIDITFEDIRKCEKIIYAGNPDSSDAHLFIEFIKLLFPKGVQEVNIDALNLYSLSENEILKTIENPKPFNQVFANEVKEGKLKKYFDYNFNLNSFALLGKAYYQVDNEIDKREKYNNFGVLFISKYMLQTLYFIRNEQQQSRTYTEGELFSEFYDWNGTGKYQIRASLGNEASRSSIFKNLLDLKLLSIQGGKVTITLKGVKFLNNLPKDCQDYDLPFRLKQWSELHWEEGKLKIDNYLFSFFKKVKNKLKSF